MVSDRDAKENVEPVDARAVLGQVAELTPATRNDEDQDDSIRHMGPVAQDFYAAFRLGLGEKTIDTIDPKSITLSPERPPGRLSDPLLQAPSRVAHCATL